jgi:hypothetical protein
MVRGRSSRLNTSTSSSFHVKHGFSYRTTTGSRIRTSEILGAKEIQNRKIAAAAEARRCVTGKRSLFSLPSSY